MRERIEDGEVVDGRYRVSHRIGSGGMADVFCATDLQLGRKVALKLLHARFATDEAFVERFRREASSAAGLQHQNVVSVYDRGEVDGTSYIAMELVEGRTLKQLVQEEGPLDPERAVDLTEQVLAAAKFAHRRGIIHRDLKPHNVIVDAEDRAKVTDFGIAKAGASDMTETGSIMGTAQYLSPEQAQGLPVSAASDLYSVGILLFEQLTGRVPFDGDSAVAIALKQVNEPPPVPSALNPAVPPELDEVVRTALAKEPAGRYRDAQAFSEALEDARPALRAHTPTAAGVTTGSMPVVAPVPVPAPWETGSQPATAGWSAPVAPHQTGEHYVLTPEGEVPHDPDERRTRWWWAAVGVLLVAVCVVGALLVTRSTEVPLPDVVGRSQANAERILRDAGFSTDAVRRESTRPVGTVVDERPDPGGSVERGAVITLTISSGPGQESVPPLVNVGRGAARRQLEQLGFGVREVRERSASVTTNSVIRTDPPSGALLDRGAVVTLTVSSGPIRIDVPSVSGLGEAEARQRLRAAGFVVVSVQQQSTEVEAGRVIDQTPEGSSAAAQGTTVTITVATAPPRTAVPDVTGRSQDTATTTLSGAGFRVRVVQVAVASEDDDGIVQSQTPGSGTQRSDGATVTIRVGRATEQRDPTDSGSNGGAAATTTTTSPGGATVPQTTTTPAPSGGQ